MNGLEYDMSVITLINMDLFSNIGFTGGLLSVGRRSFGGKLVKEYGKGQYFAD